MFEKLFELKNASPVVSSSKTLTIVEGFTFVTSASLFTISPKVFGWSL